MSSEDDKNKNVAGFAGLSSLVSDVEIDTDVPKSAPTTPVSAKQVVPDEEQKSATSAQQSSQTQSTAQPYQAPTQPSDNSGWKWVLGIGAVIAVIWMAAGSGNKNQASPSYSSSPSVPSYSPPAATPAAPSRLSEELPPAGTNTVLSSAQLRYCLAEDIRLESAKAAVNYYIDSHVDRFNGMVSDYNNRCGQFRYRKGALESARSEVERYRADLQAEGRGRFSTGVPATPKLTPQAVKPTPDPTVKAIQQRLNVLGYDAGTADGFIGGKTRSAISSFQRDSGLTADGKPTEDLLRKLQSTERPKAKEPSPPQPSIQPQFIPAPPPPTATKPVQTPSWGTGETSGKPDLSQVDSFEQEGIERACDSARKYSGPSAYYDCLKRELSSLRSSGGRPDMSRANSSEKDAIERACDSARKYSGPGAYYGCLKRELGNLNSTGGRPDLSAASSSELDAIERACDSARKYSGPGAYYACLKRELGNLQSTGGRPDMSGATSSEQEAIERACDSSKKYSGPGAYYGCLKRELGNLRSSGGRPDMSRANYSEQAAIERACESAQKYSGPGTYYSCLRRELGRLGYR
jgi:hypothetical protein